MTSQILISRYRMHVNARCKCSITHMLHRIGINCVHSVFKPIYLPLPIHFHSKTLAK